MIDRYNQSCRCDIFKNNENGQWVKFEDHVIEMMDYGNSLKHLIPDNRITEDELQTFFREVTFPIFTTDIRKFLQSKGLIK